MNLKTLMQLTLLAGLIVAFCCSSQAQDDQATSNGAIVVLDVAKVFKANASFNQQIERIQSEAEALKTKVEKQQTALRARAQNVSENFKVNTPERKEAEGQLEQEMTSLRTFARQAEADLMGQEAKIYYETYLQMQAIVAAAAQENGIALVLRFDSSEPEPDNRSSIVGIVNRAIVFQKDRDLTGYVIEKMNPGRTATNPSTLQK